MLLSLIVEEFLNNIDEKYISRFSGNIGPRFYLRPTSSESPEMDPYCMSYIF